MARLTQDAKDFGPALNKANPNLPAATVEKLTAEHVTTLAGAVDALGAGDPSVFAKLRSAAGHMPMIADPLAGAIVKQFPSKFAG